MWGRTAILPLLIKNEHKETNETKHEIDVRWMADIVAREGINVSVTTITFEGIIKKVINSWKLVRTQLETVQPSRRNKPFYTARLQAFQQRFNKLFDVALDSKIYPIEVPFLDDQRGARCMYIGNIDTDALRRVELSSAREAAEEARRQREVNRLSQVPNPDNTNCMVVGDRRNDVAAADIATSDVNQKAGPSASATDTNPEPDDIHKPTSSQNRLLLATVSREADRYGVSDRAAAAIATAALMDASPSFEVSHVIDPSKLRRSRKRLRFEVSATANTDRQVLGLYFDGRKDAKCQTLAKDQACLMTIRWR